MWSLAVHTNAIAELLAKESRTPEEFAQLRQAVDDVAKLAAGLALDPAAKRHPLVKKGLDPFQNSVTAAQAGLAKDPPDLSAVDAVAAACRACHAGGQPRKAPFSL